MKYTLYQIDAFAEAVFQGNPAAVCLPDEWPEDSLMQRIAAENNLAETAFVVRNGNRYEIRWFTPEIEVDLCGHATLASAYVIFRYREPDASLISFFSPRSGPLAVEKGPQGMLVLDFPADLPTEVAAHANINKALGLVPVQTWKGKTDYMLVYRGQEDIENLRPDFFLLNQVEARGIIATAPGRDTDFVSRFFAPRAGINEDPVTGSAHTTLIPYWAGILGKQQLTARQLSKRGGSLQCQAVGNRVRIGGKAVQYLVGEIQV